MKLTTTLYCAAGVVLLAAWTYSCSSEPDPSKINSHEEIVKLTGEVVESFKKDLASAGLDCEDVAKAVGRWERYRRKLEKKAKQFVGESEKEARLVEDVRKLLDKHASLLRKCSEKTYRFAVWVDEYVYED
ncbi:hypothetical protein ACFL2F_01140 [Myxococcota bacterium]